MAVFLQEDGQLALGSKTPVSILQEILHKKRLTPQYELLYNGVGMPEPIFKFQVSAEGLTAIGDGKTKKEAKHDAAATLLKRLLANGVETLPDLPISKEEVEIASPYTGALKTNYVGRLDEICFLNKIPSSNYVPVREEGPPHARVFTMKCDLSSVSEIAVARTKKQAKHMVAQKMIEKVSKILKDRFVPPLENDDTCPPDVVVSNMMAIQNGTFLHDLTYKVGELHNVFHIIKDEQPQPLPSVFTTLPEKPDEFYESMEEPMEFLEEVVTALEGVVQKNHVTQEEFSNSLNVFTTLLNGDDWEIEHEEDGNDQEIEHEEDNTNSEREMPDEHNLLSRVNDLPDFPLSENNEDKNGIEEYKCEKQGETFTLKGERKCENQGELSTLKDECKCENQDDTSALKEELKCENQDDISTLKDENRDGLFILNGERKCVNQSKQSILNGVNNIPDFLISEDEEAVKFEEGVVSQEENKLDLRKEVAVVHSFIKIEVPIGLWEFIGRGGSNQEALNQAARKALKFLRFMAITPAQ